jgi:flagellar hook-length control protein FliK
VRAPQVHANSGQQAALNGDTAARAITIEAPTEAKVSQPQGFTTLVESIEKGGAEAKPVTPVIENPLDAVGTSGGKNMPNTQSTSSNIAKADTATPQPLAKEEVIHQIVDSAKLRFQNGQGEMRIQLKPESLGHVRLNISTNQHQVMVKVVAELPMVKELLESNLPQLRAELQGQGLEIDKFDVSVGGDDASQNKEQQTWAQRQNGRRGGGAFAQEDPENPGEQRAPMHHRQPKAERETDGVDYFA